MSEKPVCVQCGDCAELSVRWLAKASETVDESQQAKLCGACMSQLWARFHSTQFGQTIQIEAAA